MIILSRFLSITATCYLVAWIPLNTWWGLFVWGGMILFAVGIFTIIYKNLEKIQAWFKGVLRKKDKKKQ
jgi:hypothetical protein